VAGPFAAQLDDALAPHGLILRGGFHPGAGEGLEGVCTVIMIGNAGGAMWAAFAPHVDGERNPLDRWTKSVVDPIAERFGARPVYPFDPAMPPFQRWALRADAVHPSPLGILIHPEYGLWHAYRAALLFVEKLDLPTRSDAPSPCQSCAAKPCLSACPVGAFSGDAYDVVACADHISKPVADCISIGCHARNACPVGREWRYPEAQVHFHMAAFARSVSRPGPPEN
jgi:ferredoxin-like protein FixX